MLLRNISRCCKEALLPSKHCEGMRCAVVQQACREVHTSLEYQSDLYLSVAVLYQ